MAEFARLRIFRLTVLTRVSTWLPGALLLFFVAAFALPREPAYALVFYVVVLPCLLARVAAGPWPDVTAPARVFAVGLIVFSALTLLWGVDDGGRSWRFAGSAAATLGFLLAMLAVLGDVAWRDRLAAVLVVGGGLNAAWSIGYAVVTHPRNPRLHGWGATSHPILGATVMAVAGLTALSWALAPVAPRRRRVVALAAALFMGAFILMTESRGPLLAASAAVVLLCAVSVWRVRAFLGLGVMAAIWFALPKAARDHGAAVLVARGSSHRWEIWQYTLGLIRDRPFFGHGLAANLHLDLDASDLITFPHDMYLSLLFYSGAVGALIFAGLAALLTWRLWRGRRDAEWPWLAALWLNMLVSGLTDIGQITKGPGPVWFIVWLPVGLLLTWARSN